jgi:hypothetical protein
MLEFRQVSIVFGDAVEPARLRGLLGLLAAVTQLVDGTIWEENRRKMDDLPPYCTKCACFGHHAAACPHFNGRGRKELGFAPHRRHVEGTQTLELLGCTADLDRVVAVNGRRYVVGEATGDDNNCLIDTLWQVLKPGGLADSAGYLARVRSDLAAIDSLPSALFKYATCHTPPVRISWSSWSTRTPSPGVWYSMPPVEKWRGMATE